MFTAAIKLEKIEKCSQNVVSSSYMVSSLNDTLKGLVSSSISIFDHHTVQRKTTSQYSVNSKFASYTVRSLYTSWWVTAIVHHLG